MTIAEQVRANQNVNEMLEKSLNILAKLENKNPEQIYTELEEETMELTKEELKLMRDIAEKMLGDLEASELKNSTRSLLDNYSKVLDLGGDSSGIAEEVLREELLKAEKLMELSSNSLDLLQVVYQDGVEGCDKLLESFAMRGLHEAVKARRDLLVSTLSKVEMAIRRKETELFRDMGPFELQESIEEVIQSFRELDVEVTRRENGLYRTLDLGSGYELTDLTEQDLREAYYTFTE